MRQVVVSLPSNKQRNPALPKPLVQLRLHQAPLMCSGLGTTIFLLISLALTFSAYRNRTMYQRYLQLVFPLQPGRLTLMFCQGIYSSLSLSLSLSLSCTLSAHPLSCCYFFNRRAMQGPALSALRQLLVDENSRSFQNPRDPTSTNVTRAFLNYDRDRFILHSLLG